MATELDLDDAVGNVTGNVARRELDELRRQRDELAEALRELVEAGEDVWDFNRPCLQEGRNALANLDSEQAEQPEILEGVQENGKKWPECVCPDRPDRKSPKQEGRE